MDVLLGTVGYVILGFICGLIPTTMGHWCAVHGFGPFMGFAITVIGFGWVFLTYLIWGIHIGHGHTFVQICLILALCVGACSGFLVLPYMEHRAKLAVVPAAPLPEDRQALLDDTDDDSDWRSL